MKVKITKTCLRRGFDVHRDGRLRAMILGYEDESGKVAWEVDLNPDLDSVKRFRFGKLREAKAFAKHFAESLNWRFTMHKAAGGTFDEFMAGKLATLPHEELV